MTKYGLANEKHDHTPPEFGCSLWAKRGCGKSNHQCCFFCDILYRCQEKPARCTKAWFAMKNQPNPAPFNCRESKTTVEITWDLIFNGTDTY